MALATSNIVLPREVLGTIVGKIQDESVIARLSTPTPSIFADQSHLYFTPSAEAEVVGENAAKSAYDQSITPVAGKLVKVQTTTRVSQELKWADDDSKLEIIQKITEDQAKAIGRAVDYVGIHAINPKTGAVLTGYNHITGTGHVSVTAQATAHQSIDALVTALNSNYAINGLALSPTFANQMRTERNSLAQRIFPDVPMNLQVANVDGVAAATSSTVNGVRATTATGVLAILGNFDLFRWGMVRNPTAEVIEFGDPDGAGDLKRYNQIAYRTEACFAYALLDPAAFAVLEAE